MRRFTMRYFIMHSVTLGLWAGSLLFSSIAFAAQGMVLMGTECDYQLLAMPDGAMAVIKTVEGDHPQKNDILVGAFSEQSFSKLTNQRTGKVLNIWIDEIDSNANQALNRYSSYCSK